MDSVLSIILIILIILLMAGHSLFLYKRGRFFVFDPLVMFWAGCLIIYVYQPIVYYDSLIGWYGERIYNETLMYILTGLLFLVIGYEGSWGRKWGKFIPSIRGGLSSKKFFIVSLLLIVLGAFGQMMEFNSAGGLESWASTPRGATDWEAISGYWKAVTSLLPAGVGLLLLHIQIKKSSLVNKVIAWVLFGLLMVWFIYIGTRSRLIALVMTGIMTYYLPKNKNPNLLVVLIIFVCLFFVSNFLSNYRDNFKNFSFNLDGVSLEEIFQTSLPGLLPNESDFTYLHPTKSLEISCTMASIKLVPDVVDFNYGYSELEFLTRIVPRGIWNNKIYPQYDAFTPIYYYGGLTDYWVPYGTTSMLAGPAFGYIGHWYAVGGIVALCLAGLFTGGIYRAVRCIYDKKTRSEGDLIIYMLVILIGFWDAAGTPLFWIFSFPLMLIPIVVLILLTRNKL